LTVGHSTLIDRIMTQFISYKNPMQDDTNGLTRPGETNWFHTGSRLQTHYTVTTHPSY